MLGHKGFNLDGSIKLLSQGHKPHWKELPQRPQRAKTKPPIKNRRPWKPGVDHPWNREPARRAAPPLNLAPAAPTQDLAAEPPQR